MLSALMGVGGVEGCVILLWIQCHYPKSDFTLKELWICAINYSALDFKGSAPFCFVLHKMHVHMRVCVLAAEARVSREGV